MSLGRLIRRVAAAPATGVVEEAAPTLGAELGVDDEALAELETVVATRTIGDVVLRTEEVTVTYGGLRAVDRVSIEVRAGEIVGLIGPNGAGKTSFIDAITGFTPCIGEVFLDGEPLSDVPAHARVRKGLVRTWQSVELFEDLSAENNVRVADDIGKDVWKLLSDTVRPNPPPSRPCARHRADGARRRRRPQAVRAAARAAEDARRRPLAGARPEGPAARRAGRRSRHRPRASSSASTSGRSPPPASAAC